MKTILNLWIRKSAEESKGFATSIPIWPKAAAVHHVPQQMKKNQITKQFVLNNLPLCQKNCRWV